MKFFILQYILQNPFLNYLVTGVKLIGKLSLVTLIGTSVHLHIYTVIQSASRVATVQCMQIEVKSIKSNIEMWKNVISGTIIVAWLLVPDVMV